MNYQISEDEFYSLESVRDQLGLVTGLFAPVRSSEALSFVTAAQLGAFVDAQETTMARVIDAANERAEQARAAQREEAAAPKVPQVSIAPELLMGLMDAACGALNDSEALNKLWNALYDAGTQHRPYMAALGHFVDVLRARGVVMHVQSIDGQASYDFVPAQSIRSKGATPAKARKREKLARGEA